MRKLTRIAICAIAPAWIAGAAFGASCSDGLDQKTWDGTAAGYCRIFFPDCTAETLGRRVSYSREMDPAEVVCVGEKGAYTGFYRVTLAAANAVFGTSFDKMGVNYSGDMSKWLFDNCQNHCGAAAAVQPSAGATTDDTPAMESKTNAPAE
ncbi:MAG: hypothetical protein FWC61_03020 [Proteobacteria bacterium]|nr:hypothetical protein [Pseudomonadota bacterium]